jgi:hypothetical protein
VLVIARADFDHRNALGRIQKWHCIHYGPARLTAVSQRDRDMFGSQRGDTGRKDQRGPAKFEKNIARIEDSLIVVTATNRLTDGNQVGAPGFFCQDVARKIRAPFATRRP